MGAKGSLGILVVVFFGLLLSGIVFEQGRLNLGCRVYANDNREKIGGDLAWMNTTLDFAIEKCDELPQDKEALLRLIEALLSVKRSLMRKLPDVYEVPFIDLYYPLKFLDRALVRALHLTWDKLASNREKLEQLKQAQADKEALESSLQGAEISDQMRANLAEMNRELSERIRELEKQVHSDQALEESIKRVLQRKSDFLEGFPDIYNGPFHLWYRSLGAVDNALERAKGLAEALSDSTCSEEDIKAIRKALEDARLFKETLLGLL